MDTADPLQGEPFAFVSFCPLGAEKISVATFRWSATNFTPMRDVAVVHYSSYDIRIEKAPARGRGLSLLQREG